MLGLVAAFVVSQAAAPASLAEARRLAEELQFAEAANVLEVVRQDKTLSSPERREVLSLLARCLVAATRVPQAESVYTQLLTLMPDFALEPQASPKLREVFDRVKARLYPARFVELQALPATPGQVRVRVVDPWHSIARLTLLTRLQPGPWANSVMTPDADYVLVHTFELEPGKRLEWYLAALDDAGVELDTYGTADSPLVYETRAAKVDPPPYLPPPPPQPKSRVPAVVVAGVGVVILAVATGLMISSVNLDKASRDPTKPPGDFADTARAANLQAQTQAEVGTACFVIGGLAAGASIPLFVW